MKSSGTAPIVYRLQNQVYINLTSRCWLRCGFCPKFQGQWALDGTSLRLQRKDEPSVAEVLRAVDAEAPASEVVFCGFGEPTLRLPALLKIGSALKGRGVRVRLNTDGLANLRQGRDVTTELASAVDAMSISLNAHNAHLYARHCRPPATDAYAAVIDFAERAVQVVPEVALSAIDGLDGVDIAQCQRIAALIGAQFRHRVLGRVGREAR